MRQSRYTVYDMLNARGFFDDNPANTTSSRYAGPVEYPKMFYHPKGETRVTQAAETVVTPYGPTKVGEQSELISRVVNDAEEEKRIRAAGWHDHPAKAIEASGMEAPPMASHGKVADLERQIANLQAQLNLSKAAPKPNLDEFGIEIPSTAKSVVSSGTPRE